MAIFDGGRAAARVSGNGHGAVITEECLSPGRMVRLRLDRVDESHSHGLVCI